MRASYVGGYLVAQSDGWSIFSSFYS